MKRLAACLLALATLATSTVQAQFVPISVDFAEAPVSYELKTSVGNTPTIRVTFKNSGASTNISSWTPYLKWSKNESAVDGMVTVAGTATSDYAEFVCSTNTFGRATKDGYFAIYLSRSGGNENITVVRGRINIFPSPEVSQQAALATTTLVNWNLLSFTGTPPWTALNYPTDVVVSTWVVASSNLARSAYTIATNSLPLSASNNFYRADNPSGYVAYASVHPAAVLASNALPRSGGLLTGDVDLTNAGLTSLDFAEFDAAPTGAIAPRRLQWNAARDTLRLGLNSTVNYDLGHQVILYARNADSNTVNKGEVVYISGSSGDSATFMRASNDSETRSARTIGIMAETVAQNNFGNIVNQGTIYNLDTSAFPAGAGLYLGAGGTMQTNLPTAPLHGVFLGVVERSHANVGQIYVTIQNYQELRELSDVRLNGQTNLNVLTYISASNRWEARSVSSMEADPFWAAVSNDIHARIVAASNLAYTASTAPVDQTARDWATAASNLALSASRSSTDLAARVWIQSISNLALSASYSSTDLVSRAWNQAASNKAATALSDAALASATGSAAYGLAAYSSNRANSAFTYATQAWTWAYAGSNLAYTASTNAQSAKELALFVSNALASTGGIDTNATHQALAASNLAASAYTFATQAHVWAQSGSNLAFQTDANLTAASNSLSANIVAASNSLSANLALASNLAFRADMTASIARVWAIAASNQVDIVATNNYFTSNSLSSNLSLASNLAFRADMTAGIARGWAIAASNQASVVATNNYFTSNSIMANLVLASNSLAANIVLTSNAFPELASISNRLTQIATNNYFTSNTFITASQVITAISNGTYNAIRSTNLFLGLFDAQGRTGINNSAYGNARFGVFEGSAVIDANSYGNMQMGQFSDIAHSRVVMEPGVRGSIQRGIFYGNPDATNIIAQEVFGAEQAGEFALEGYNSARIGSYSHGASQRGAFLANTFIGESAYGAQQIGYVGQDGSATNYGVGAIQLLNVDSGNTALTTADGYGSILLGPGTNSVAYSVNAAGGFYGNGANVTNVNARQLGGALPSAYLTVTSYQNANTNHLRFLTTTVKPSTPTDPGSHGEVRFDATNIYIYMQAGGTNMWMRIPGSFTW